MIHMFGVYLLFSLHRLSYKLKMMMVVEIGSYGIFGIYDR